MVLNNGMRKNGFNNCWKGDNRILFFAKTIKSYLSLDK